MVDISSLFVENDENANAAAEHSAELSGSTESSIGFGVPFIRPSTGEFVIQVDYVLSNPFTPQYYNSIGLTDKPFYDGASLLSGHSISTTPVSSQENCNVVWLPDFDILSTNFGNHEKYKLYGYAKAANGLYYNIYSNSPITFFASVPRVTIKSTTDTSCTLNLSNLEQFISSENYMALGFTLTKLDFEQITIERPKNSVEEVVDYTTTERDFNITMSNIPSDTSFTLYLYKKTTNGFYHLITPVLIKTRQDNVPSCTLDYRIKDQEITNGNHRLICSNYPVITASNLKKFREDINSVRVKAGLPKFIFTDISAGDPMNHGIFNELVWAINALYNNSFLNDMAENHHKITSEFISDIEYALISKRDSLWR